jgi:hypothetical protein
MRFNSKVIEPLNKKALYIKTMRRLRLRDIFVKNKQCRALSGRQRKKYYFIGDNLVKIKHNSSRKKTKEWLRFVQEKLSDISRNKSR